MGLRTALLLLSAYLVLEFVAQGWLEWRDMQAGFQRELPVTMCSPITGRTLPVDLWAEYDAALAAKGE